MTNFLEFNMRMLVTWIFAKMFSVFRSLSAKRHPPLCADIIAEWCLNAKRTSAGLQNIGGMGSVLFMLGLVLRVNER